MRRWLPPMFRGRAATKAISNIEERLAVIQFPEPEPAPVEPVAEAVAETATEAALEAARMRLRPILMTSLAFVLGVLPLALANGAGAGSQNAIGFAVMGGMISATALAILYVPIFFALIARPVRQPPAAATPLAAADGGAPR